MQESSRYFQDHFQESTRVKLRKDAGYFQGHLQNRYRAVSGWCSKQVTWRLHGGMGPLTWHSQGIVQVDSGGVSHVRAWALRATETGSTSRLCTSAPKCTCSALTCRCRWPCLVVTSAIVALMLRSLSTIACAQATRAARQKFLRDSCRLYMSFKGPCKIYVYIFSPNLCCKNLGAAIEQRRFLSRRLVLLCGAHSSRDVM